MSVEIKVEGTVIEVSNPDKVLFPQEGITKADLVTYYHRISGTMLPHVKGRLVTMRRFPDGIGEEGFYEKKRPTHFPDWISGTEIRLAADGAQTQFSIDDARTLVYLADQACITPHIWLSRKDAPDRPDKLLFDLDPPGQGFATVREAALLLKDRFNEMGIASFPMTTGSRGAHVVVPISKGPDFNEVREVAKKVGSTLVQEHPGQLTMEMRKEKRKGRLFLDFTRNSYGQTSVAPYAVRPKAGAPIATPLEWRELDKDMSSQRYRIDNIFRRLGQKDDPWERLFDHGVNIRSIVRQKRIE
jgi:bifunctional non-homologous end joining protein LigD